MTVEERGPGDAELVAELVANTIDAGEVEAVIARLERSDLIDEASWTSATSD